MNHSTLAFALIHACRFQHGFEVQNKGVSRLSMLDTISTRGATTILDCMELEIVRIQIYRYFVKNHEDSAACDREEILSMCVL